MTPTEPQPCTVWQQEKPKGRWQAIHQGETYEAAAAWVLSQPGLRPDRLRVWPSEIDANQPAQFLDAELNQELARDWSIAGASVWLALQQKDLADLRSGAFDLAKAGRALERRGLLLPFDHLLGDPDAYRWALLAGDVYLKAVEQGLTALRETDMHAELYALKKLGFTGATHPSSE
jgi:hypothetical protein